MTVGKLDRRVALITGGNSGIGFATAQEFVGEGAHVFITGRRERELAAAMREMGRNVTGIRADVSNSEDLDRLFSQIESAEGRLDVVFANAGTAKYAPLGQVSEELYRSIFDVNVKGVLFTVQKALPLIPEGGSVILNASIVASKRPPCKQCLQRYQGGGTLVCGDVDDRFERPAHSCKCREPWFHRYGGPKETVRFLRSRTATVKSDSRIGPTWTACKTQRNRPGRRVSRVRRQQLDHRDGIVRRRRVRTSVSESDM